MRTRDQAGCPSNRLCGSRSRDPVESRAQAAKQASPPRPPRLPECRSRGYAARRLLPRSAGRKEPPARLSAGCDEGVGLRPAAHPPLALEQGRLARVDARNVARALVRLEPVERWKRSSRRSPSPNRYRLVRGRRASRQLPHAGASVLRCSGCTRLKWRVVARQPGQIDTAWRIGPRGRPPVTRQAGFRADHPERQRSVGMLRVSRRRSQATPQVVHRAPRRARLAQRQDVLCPNSSQA